MYRSCREFIGLIKVRNSIKGIILSLAFIYVSNTNAEILPKIEVLTEPTPFTLLDTVNAGGGEATRFVKQVLDHAEIGFDISYVPWKRSYRRALRTSDVLIYPIARTEHREKQFIWVGRIIPISYFLFKLKNRKDIQLDIITQAKNYSIGVVNDHAHHEYLIEKGLTNFQAVNSSEQNLRKLLLGRIDLFPLSSGGIKPLCTQLEIDCSQIVPVMALEDFSDGLYMAFSLDSNPAIVERAQSSYQQIVQRPRHQSLFRARLLNASLVETSLKP